MNIFNIFKKKYSIQELKNDIDKYISRLENISTTMPIEVEKIRSVPLDELPEKAKNNASSLQNIEVKISNAMDTVGLLTNVKNQGQEFENTVQKVTMNLGVLKVIMEMELKDANSHIKAVNLFHEYFEGFLSKLNLLVQEIPAFTEELRMLKKKKKSSIQESKAGIGKYISKLESSSNSIVRIVEEIKNLTLNELPKKIKNSTSSLQNLEIKMKDVTDSVNLLINIKNQGQEFGKEVQKATINLGTLNTAVEPIFMDKDTALKAVNKSYGNLTHLLQEFRDLDQEMPFFKEELITLKEKIKKLEKE